MKIWFYEVEKVSWQSWRYWWCYRKDAFAWADDYLLLLNYRRKVSHESLTWPRYWRHLAAFKSKGHRALTFIEHGNFAFSDFRVFRVGGHKRPKYSETPCRSM